MKTLKFFFLPILYQKYFLPGLPVAAPVQSTLGDVNSYAGTGGNSTMPGVPRNKEALGFISIVPSLNRRRLSY